MNRFFLGIVMLLSTGLILVCLIGLFNIISTGFNPILGDIDFGKQIYYFSAFLFLVLIVSCSAFLYSCKKIFQKS